MTYSKNIAVKGIGRWGKNLVRNFHNLGALHTIITTSPETMAEKARKYPGAEITSSFSSAINNPQIKAIAIATPPATHAELARRSLLAGKDVFVEKPMALSEKEGRALTATARDNDQILMVGHILWYHPALLKLREMVNRNELGRIRHIYCNRLQPNKADQNNEDALWSLTPHDISAVIGLLKEMPSSVQASRQPKESALALLSFTSGTSAHIFASRCHPDKEQKLIVAGDKKTAVFNDTAPWPEKLQTFPPLPDHTHSPPSLKHGEAIRTVEDEPLRAECTHFLDCIATRKKPRTDGSEGLRVLQVLSACQTAMNKNKPIRLQIN